MTDAKMTKKQIDHNLALWMAASPNISNSLVKEKLFKQFCTAIPGYKLPCVQTIQLKIANIAADIRTNVAALVMESERTTVCTDLWTAADGTHFVGIIAHFYCKSKRKPIRLVIGCKEITESATAPSIAKLIENVWRCGLGRDLGAHRIANYITDSGSNLIKCCNTDLPQLFAICAANDNIETEFRFDMIDVGMSIF